MTSPTTTSRRAWAIWLSACALLLAVAVVAAIIGFHDRSAARSFDQDARNRAAAVGVAQQFALRMDDFAAPSATAYVAGIEKLMTTKGKADLAQVKSVMTQVFAAAQPRTKGQQAPQGHLVFSGVSDIDADSATVLVAHDTTVTGSSKQLHFRWTVALKNIGGKWLVDGLPPEVSGGTSQ